MREEFAPQDVDHLMTHARGLIELEVIEQALAARYQNDAKGDYDDGDRLALRHQTAQPRERRRERFVQQDVIEDDLQRPRREQFHQREAEYAQKSRRKAAPHFPEMRGDDFTDVGRLLFRHKRLGKYSEVKSSFIFHFPIVIFHLSLRLRLLQ